jgi:membrane protease YdiL (CAAX protease family)
MNKRKFFHSIITSSGFLLVALLSMFSFYLKIAIGVKLCLGIIPVIITLLFYFHHFSLFVPTLFFCLNYLVSPIITLFSQRYGIQLFQLIFLPVILLYVIIILCNRRLKNEVTWLSPGKIDKWTFVIMLVIIAGSGISLFLWAVFIKKDVSDFFKFIPNLPFPLLFFFGIVVFPVFNALFEEFIARGVLYDGFKKAINNESIVIVLQAILFGIWHYGGFPGGVTGVVMVCVWSFFLGYIRFRSKGMLAPLIAHYFADLCIAIIVYVSYMVSRPVIPG